MLQMSATYKGERHTYELDKESYGQLLDVLVAHVQEGRFDWDTASSLSYQFGQQVALKTKLQPKDLK